MFRYFEGSQMLSQGFLLAMNAGGEINEVDRACRKVVAKDGIPEVSSWFSAWTELGDLLVARPTPTCETPQAQRRPQVPPRLRLLRSLRALHSAHRPRKAEGFARMRLLPPLYRTQREPVEFVEVPYEGGKSMPALFVPAAAAGQAP